jgi:hypothetical protein
MRKNIFILIGLLKGGDRVVKLKIKGKGEALGECIPTK